MRHRMVLQYWADVTIACSQVFFGISIATLFVDPTNQIKVTAAIVNMMLAIFSWMIGWYVTRL